MATISQKSISDPQFVVLNSKNSFLIVATLTGLKRFDFPSLNLMIKGLLPFEPWALEMSPDDSVLYTINSNFEGVYLYSSFSLQKISIILEHTNISRLFRLDLKECFAAGTSYGDICFFSSKNNELINEVSIFDSFTTALAANRKQTFIMIACADNKMNVLSLSDLTTLRSFTYNSDIQFIHFSNDDCKFYLGDSRSVKEYSSSDFLLQRQFEISPKHCVDHFVCTKEELFLSDLKRNSGSLFTSWFSKKIQSQRVITNWIDRFLFMYHNKSRKLSYISISDLGIEALTPKKSSNRSRKSVSDKLGIKRRERNLSTCEKNVNKQKKFSFGTFDFFRGTLVRGQCTSRVLQSFVIK